MKVRVFGAARQMTGSRYMLEAGGLRILADWGMYQEREFLSRNWEDFPVAADSVDYVLLTHAHLDHLGLLPKLVRDGFAGRILTTAASGDLTEIVLYDTGRIQEEDAVFKRRRHEGEGRKTARDKTVPRTFNVRYRRRAEFVINDFGVTRVERKTDYWPTRVCCVSRLGYRRR